MTEKEFDILDELYFVVSFNELMETTGEQEGDLKECLREMIKKEWVACYRENEDVPVEHIDIFEQEYKHLTYVATKAGLLAHNQF